MKLWTIECKLIKNHVIVVIRWSVVGNLWKTLVIAFTKPWTRIKRLGCCTTWRPFIGGSKVRVVLLGHLRNNLISPKNGVASRLNIENYEIVRFHLMRSLPLMLREFLRVHRVPSPISSLFPAASRRRGVAEPRQRLTSRKILIRGCHRLARCSWQC